MRSHFPTPVHTVLHTSAVLPATWQLHSDFRDFSNGICHVMEITTAQKNPDMELSTHFASTPDSGVEAFVEQFAHYTERAELEGSF